MSLHEKAVRTLAGVLGMELIKSTTKNPFAPGYGKYCLWMVGGEGGPLHNASLREVQLFLQSEVDDYLHSPSAGE